MMPKKGLAGTYDYRGLQTKSHKEMLGLEDGFLLVTWGADDPRATHPNLSIEHTWYPTLWGDTLERVDNWTSNIPHDYGKQLVWWNVPADYSYYANDGYSFGDYLEYVDDTDPARRKRRVRVAFFLNEPDQKAIKNEQGFAESAGMPADMAAFWLYTMTLEYPHIHWIPRISSSDLLTGGHWTRLFFKTLVDRVLPHVKNEAVERSRPFRRLIHGAIQLYPKGFDELTDLAPTDVDWYIKEYHKILDEFGLQAEHRKYVFITETNSRVAQAGPDFPAPAGDYTSWGPKRDWPGARRWRKWTRQMNENPWIIAWAGYIGTNPNQPHHAFIDEAGKLTENGRIFAAA